MSQRKAPSAGDVKALERLVRKYGRDTIADRAKDVVLRSAGRTRRGNEPKPLPPLSLTDTKELARLVRKYGRDQLPSLAGNIVLEERRGRPKRGDAPYYELMHLADCTEEWAEEYRAAGSQQPYRDAELDVYDFSYNNNRLDQVAQLTDLAYRQQRIKIAKELGVVPRSLDKERAKRRKGGRIYKSLKTIKKKRQQGRQSWREVAERLDELAAGSGPSARLARQRRKALPRWVTAKNK